MPIYSPPKINMFLFISSRIFPKEKHDRVEVHFVLPESNTIMNLDV